MSAYFIPLSLFGGQKLWKVELCIVHQGTIIDVIEV